MSLKKTTLKEVKNKKKTQASNQSSDLSTNNKNLALVSSKVKTKKLNLDGLDTLIPNHLDPDNCNNLNVYEQPNNIVVKSEELDIYSQSVREKKAENLALAISMIHKQFGQGSIMRLGDHKISDKIDVISTGSIALDACIGIGGLPKGRVVEIYGAESSGKTTLSLMTIAECQKNGGTAAFIDAEHALDPNYAKLLGVDIENLIIAQPDSGEEALEIADVLVKSASIDMIVIDSVAALTPKVELEGTMGASHVGLQARLMSQALRKITANLQKSNTLLIFINQIRMKIGVMFGNPETTSGGNALKFYSSVRLDVRKFAALKKEEQVIGHTIRIKVVKNKVGAPFRQADYDIIYGLQPCREREILQLSAKYGFLELNRGRFYYNQSSIGRLEQAVSFLLSNKDLRQELYLKLLEIAH